MAGTLFVVATPIGHLEDITLRALRVLREVDLIAAEDTRRTSRLLGHYGIQTKLISVHEHNERARIPTLLGVLQVGKSVALVSDAGTPGASDPGMLVVRAARAAGIRVDAVPGPSAVMAALSLGGYEFDQFLFAGFPPIRLKDRKRWFAWVKGCGALVVFFEAPHRIRRTLADTRIYLGKQPIIVARELTKRFEEVLEGTPDGLLDLVSTPRGEFTVILPPPTDPQSLTLPAESGGEDDAMHQLLDRLFERGTGSKREIARQVANRLGLRVRDVYQALIRQANDR